MFTLVYKSEAVENLDTAEIKKMLWEAQIQNKTKGITGCLLYHKGKFVQLIEGEEAAVKTLFSKIKKDVRHRKVIILNMEESVLRIFSEWSMIYDDVESGQLLNRKKKKRLFNDIFHSSNAVCTPGSSKLALWTQMRKILGKKKSQAA